MNDPEEAGHEVLDRVVAMLRDAPIPSGPSDSVQRETLEALDGLGYRRRKWNRVLVGIGVAASIAFMALIVQAHRRARELNRDSQELISRVNTPAPNPPPMIATTQMDRQALPLPTSPPRAIVVASDLSIRGHVFYRGPHPARKPIDLRSCPQCSQVIDGPIYDNSLIVNEDGTLGNVVVSISGGLPPGAHFIPPREPVVLDQKGCLFHPHVVAAMVGQPIVVKNSDPLLHSVHSMDAELSPAFDFAQPTLGERRVDPMRIVETFQVRCDLHPWMNAWVRVFNHPYFAVTSADGTFAIRRLPAGRYRLKAWHELLGVREKTIELRQGQAATIDFTFDR